MASASSSTGSVPNHPRKYDVFISFRGKDTRTNFISHLYAALKRASLEVFRDDKKLEKGNKIAPSLVQAIKDSSVSVIVFSEDYASSKWCLDELDQIMQYRKEEGQFVIPIFYKVDPTDVRNQTGAFENAFEKNERDFIHDPTDRVNRWRFALFEAGKLSGWHCETFMDESKLIQEMVTDVSTKLERIYKFQVTLNDVIGIDEMVKPIEALLKKSHKVGIWGMGGVGKTTMAKAVFVKLSFQYDCCFFFENLREKTERSGLEQVENSLISELLGQNMQSNSSNALRNSAFVSRRLGCKKALIVLDDVETIEQLKNLHENICNFLREGSKIIITTRDQKLLRGKGYEIYEAKGLSYENACRLFIHKAFGSNNPKHGYEELIQEFVGYTKCNPLALEVLGLHVHSEDKQLWGELLRKLREGNPNEKIQKVLSLSYDRLDHTEKQIFLDIACFLKGETEEFVIELMESYGLYPIVGMQTLKDKALINTTRGIVEMHDLIQKMGRQIVREENINAPGKRSRLFDYGEILKILKNCEGEHEVEAIVLLDRFERRPLVFTSKAFNKMKRLRFLKIFDPVPLRPRDRSTPTGLELTSNEIRYFYWKGYRMKSLPSNFCAEHLLELDLGGSLVETLWEGVQDLANLRRLKLYGSLNLRELPDFSKACRLESVDLSYCGNLCYVPSSLISHHSLISLNVSYCRRLESLQSRIHLQSLEDVNLYGCDNLKEFSMSSEELTCLYLAGTKIEELSPSIWCCAKLSNLILTDTRLNNLPDDITQLSSLDQLDLSECPDLTKLPDNMRHLSQLQYLYVQDCTALQSLPELPPSLIELNATNCTSLETVSTSTIPSTPHKYGENIFSFMDCVNLDMGPIEKKAKLLLEKAVHEKEGVTVYYPGEKVPEWFGNNRTKNDSSTLKLRLSIRTLVGFVFCAVTPDFPEKDLYANLHIAFSIEEDEMTDEVVEFPKLTDFRPENVLLRSYPKASESILKKIEGNRGNHEATTYSPNLFFTFSFQDWDDHYPSKECGVCPIYGSGYSVLNSNSRKRKAIYNDFN